MEYKIVNRNGEVIAKFENECDRDISYDALVDYFGDDCELERTDG